MDIAALLATKAETPQESQTVVTPAEQPPIGEAEYTTATFQGLYYKGVANGKEAVSFKIDIKVPFACLRDQGYHPAWVMQKMGKSLLGKDAAFGGLRNFELTQTTKLPNDLNPIEHLNWTANYHDLCNLVKRYATERQYYPLDPSEGTPLPARRVSVMQELFSTPASLRNAIKRCMADPEAFDKEQGKLVKKWTDADTKKMRNLDNELMRLNETNGR
jgi:hypothetical protein